MDEFFLNWFILIGVMIIGVASPGPDFVVTIRNSIQFQRRAGIMTAIGIAAGIVIHVAYCIMGIATLISQSIILFNIFKYVGAAYLIYIGFIALKSKGMTDSTGNVEPMEKTMSDWLAFRNGFITNLFNPKATMFFLALFTQILSPNLSLATSLVYGTTCVVITAIWFSGVAMVLTIPAIRSRFFGYSKWVDRICGGVLIALGLRLALSKMGH
jgi:RhtB (resistance to homoserine/threonine) family protein